MKNEMNNKQIFNLRVVPWWTDGCSTFLNNIFKWYPSLLKRKLIGLEFGGGNSSFYLLGKGAKIATIESDDGYIKFICDVAKNMGYSSVVSSLADFDQSLFSEYELVVIKAKDISETGNLISENSWDFIVNDGVSRRDVLLQVHSMNENTIVILDNVEYAANWGRLDRTSAKPDLVKAYRSILRDSNWRHYSFEQEEGRDGRGSADKCGWEAPHRWVSSVLWPKDHLFAKLIVSNIGMPLVNEQGVDDVDLASLGERCPFDWKEMRWQKPSYPEELDLKLDRAYE